MSVNGTLVESKIFTFTLESTHFFKCPVYTHDGASATATIITSSNEKDYNVDPTSAKSTST